MRFIAPLALLTFFPASSLLARDVYIVQVNAVRAGLNECDGVAWRTDTVFHNTSISPATIQLRSISNSPLPPVTPITSFVVPGRHSVDLYTAVGGTWSPVSSSAGAVSLWVLRLDVPSQVLVSNQIQSGIYMNYTCLPPPGWLVTGVASLPPFSISTADVPRVHLASDLGGLPAHTNVAVYNDAAVDASVHIARYSSCDDSLLTSFDATVSRQSIQQFALPSVTPNCTLPVFSPLSTYVEVTSSEAGFSYVSAVQDGVPPQSTFAVPLSY